MALDLQKLCRSSSTKRALDANGPDRWSLICSERQTMRALVIDDSRAVRMIIGQILREIGMEVIEAANGLEALEQMKQNPDVELLLVDWNMPEMNGL